MTERSKYLLTAMGTLTILIVGMISAGVFSRNRIIVTTLATTGPHFDVVLGRRKLKMQMPDSVETDVSGVMVSDKSIKDIDDYLQDNYRAFGDYFILTVKVVGVEQSDNPSFHPLIEIYDWKHVDKDVFWFLFVLELIVLILFFRSTRKYLRLRKRLLT
jgi:hypothetical protein